MTDSSRIAWLLLWACGCLFVSAAFVQPASAATLAVNATTTKDKPQDTDGDGLWDSFELQLGTNIYSKDSDGDSFEDKTEIFTGWSPTSSARMTKSLRINVKTQKMEMKVDGITIRSFPVSTGLSKTPTPKGTFTVLNKHPRAWSRSAKLWMPYWMGFTGRGHGIHELPEWPGGRKEGANHLGRPASHGCVRLGMGAAKELYEWTPEGTRVVVD